MLAVASQLALSSHRLIHPFELGRRDLVFLDHVPAPVVFTREGTATLKPGTGRVSTMISPRLYMLIVDMPIQMCLRAELLVAALVRAVMLPVVVPLVVVQLVDLLELPPALVADEFTDVTDAAVMIATTIRR